MNALFVRKLATWAWLYEMVAVLFLTLNPGCSAAPADSRELADETYHPPLITSKEQLPKYLNKNVTIQGVADFDKDGPYLRCDFGDILIPESRTWPKQFLDQTISIKGFLYLKYYVHDGPGQSWGIAGQKMAGRYVLYDARSIKILGPNTK